MIFVLVIVEFDFFIRILKIFLQFLHPLGDYPEDWVRFHKEDPVVDLFVGVKRCVFGNLSSNQVLCVSFDLLFVEIVILGELHLLLLLITIFLFSSFVNREINFLKSFSHEADETFELLVPLFNHEVYHPHYLSSIVSVFPVLEGNPRLKNQVVLASTLVVDLGKNAPEGQVGSFDLCLRVLPAKEVQYTD